MAVNFNSRTYSMYSTLKKRGPVPFTLEQFRAFVIEKIEADSHCIYCHQLLMLKNVSADHKTPLSRAGSYDLDNIQFICQGCNKAKGNFSHEEFIYLLAILDEMQKRFAASNARRRVLMALKISSSFRFGADRRAKKGQQS